MMKNHIPNVQDYAYNALYRQRSATNAQDSLETTLPEKQDYEDFFNGVRPETARNIRGDAYGEALRRNINWGRHLMPGYPEKQFPDFKIRDNGRKKNMKTINVPEHYLYSNFKAQDARKYQDSRCSKMPEDYLRNDHFCELRNANNIARTMELRRNTAAMNRSYRDKLNMPECIKYGKKVKWHDGFGGCYAIEPNYGSHRPKYYVPKSEKMYPKYKGPMYVPNNPRRAHKYRKVLNPNYFARGDESFYPYSKPFEHIYHSPKYFPAYYGNPENWIMHEPPRNYVTYDNHKHSKSQKSYKNSKTQYDLVERVRNKKLQVTQSDNSNIPKENQPIKPCIKLSEVPTCYRLTNSEQNVPNCENAATQIDPPKPQTPKASYSNNSQQSEEHPQMDPKTIVNQVLAQLNEKLKSPDNPLHTYNKKCSMVDRDTQFEDRDIKKTWACEGSTNLIRIMKHEETQYEDHFLPLPSKPKTRNPFRTKTKCDCASRQPTKKRVSVNCRLPEDVNAINYSIRRTSLAKNAGTAVENVISDRVMHCQLPVTASEHCGPFFIDEEYQETRQKTFAASRRATKKKKKRKNVFKEDRERLNNQMVGINDTNIKDSLEEDNMMSAITDKLQFNSHRISFSKYDNPCGPDDSFLEKFIVKLSNPKERITLYNVKPKFFNYLNDRGIEKNVIDKLKSCLHNK